MELPGSVAHVDGTLESRFVWEAIVLAGVGLWVALLGLMWLLEQLRWRTGARVVFVLLSLAAAATISPMLFNAAAKAIWYASSDGTFALGLIPTNDANRELLPALLAATGVIVVALRRASRRKGIPPSRAVA